MNRPKNILHLIETSGPGGAETVLLNIVRGLDRERYNPRVVLMRPGWFAERLQAEGIQADVIESRRSFDLPFVRNLIKACREWKIDLLHSHLPGANVYASLIRFFTRIPVVTTYHGQISLPGSDEKYQNIKQFLVRNLASRVVVVADFLRDDFIRKAGFPEHKLVTIHNGVDLRFPDGRFDARTKRESLGLSQSNLVVVNVANIRVPKGQNYLVEATEKVARQFPDIRILLVGEGEGELKERLVSQIEQAGLDEQVRFFGYRTDVTEILRVSDLFVLSSISEGLPVAAVEAMAASLPIVSTDVGAMSSLVDDGQSGYLVPSGDSNALAEKMLVVLSDQKLRTSMGNVGRKIVEANFSIETMVRKYQDLYESILT
jgi:glycosyltransferase involved in cell wall biosynthesis